ncbi:hypothetical protein F511_02168 [Dorcoceras hygrometricum]|uniref:Uncharacterized protein n=1 Tax=Dorcoceras hygrometricum TaxID=472368 RepID=A0A2Z7BMU0_9LAMI|nr:hypothetical protein F511_02168 [Dorcoceras hygrometricum]
MVGMPLINQDISYLDSASHQEQFPALEFCSLTDHEQGAAQAKNHQIDQQENETPEMIAHEHQAQGNEQIVPTEEHHVIEDVHQAGGTEHHAHDDNVSVQGCEQTLEERFAVFVPSVNNQLTTPTSEQNSLDIQLKHVVDGIDVKIDVLERTLTQKVDDNTQNFAMLETTIARNYADSHQQLFDELASVKSQLATLIASLREIGSDKKGEEDRDRDRN